MNRNLVRNLPAVAEKDTPEALRIRLHLAAEKRTRALALRAAGVSFERIAREVGYKHGASAYRAVHKGLRLALIEAGSETLRALELDRLDRLHFALWPRAIGMPYALPSGATAHEPPSLDCITLVLKIARQRADLLGLKAPAKVLHSGDPASPVVVKLDLSGLGDDDLEHLHHIAAKLGHAPVPDAPAGPAGR